MAVAYVGSDFAWGLLAASSIGSKAGTVLSVECSWSWTACPRGHSEAMLESQSSRRCLPRIKLSMEVAGPLGSEAEIHANVRIAAKLWVARNSPSGSCMNKQYDQYDASIHSSVPRLFLQRACILVFTSRLLVFTVGLLRHRLLKRRFGVSQMFGGRCTERHNSQAV